MPVPIPTPIYRFTHVDNLHVLLERGGLHAPNNTPDDGLEYRTIHNDEIQQCRHSRLILCGPDGVIHDYVSFYFGCRSPMLFQLKTNRVDGYFEGQEPLIYLVSSVQTVVVGGRPFVFSDGHGIAAYTKWFSDVSDLDNVDWNAVYLEYWADTTEDMDRQRRKQAEFLVHEFCDWSLIEEIAVLNTGMKTKVENIMNEYCNEKRRNVLIKPEWYY